MILVSNMLKRSTGIAYLCIPLPAVGPKTSGKQIIKMGIE
ncbi:hypothetical protein C900_03378 [Fulvivirga imtechensis AK7]|uniref:Uncharacterized protein n=1 Tax=Fulvivirga imtechensis AK7 TaxID=1237149 RepID=L8JPM6_9BACT|nr:hypothetical protein C900_03378 [Fulvivirga imtechensis AK7]